MLRLGISAGAYVGDEFLKRHAPFLLQPRIFGGKILVALGVPGLVTVGTAQVVFGKQILRISSGPRAFIARMS